MSFSRTSREHKTVTRNKTREQNMVTRNKTQEQKCVTRNKHKGKGLYAVTHHFFACKSYGTTIAILLQPNQPQLNILSQLNQPELDILSQPKMEDDQNRR